MAAAKGNKYACKYTEKQVNALCAKLLKWAYTSDAIHLSTFAYQEIKHTKSYLYQMAEHYPQMAKALAEAKELLAQKMVNACYNSNAKDSTVNPVFAEKYLPIYDVDYEAQRIKMKTLDERAQEQSQANAMKACSDLIQDEIAKKS